MSGFQKTVADQRDIAQRLCAAFPQELVADVTSVLSVLPAAQHAPSSDDIGPVCINSESIRIPKRIYSAEPPIQESDALNSSQRLILACLLSRHHDGVVRERYADQLLAAGDEWIPPFVFALAGEYVVEILLLLSRRVEELSKERVARFAADNGVFIRLTRQRIVSYWNCYYRSRWPRFVNYPGFRFMDALAMWSTNDPRCRLAR